MPLRRSTKLAHGSRWRRSDCQLKTDVKMAKKPNILFIFTDHVGSSVLLQRRHSRYANPTHRPTRRR